MWSKPLDWRKLPAMLVVSLMIVSVPIFFGLIIYGVVYAFWPDEMQHLVHLLR